MTMKDSSLRPLKWRLVGIMLNIEKGQWHSLKCLESGTVLFEAKDGKYEPLLEEDIVEMPRG